MARSRAPGRECSQQACRGPSGHPPAKEEREGEEVRVEEVFFPVGAVLFVGGFDVEAHDGGEDLGDEEDEEARAEDGEAAGGGGGGKDRDIEQGRKLGPV